MLTPWGFNATHGIEPITVEEYKSSRYILNPLRIWDCDRPVQASTAYLFTTADRAKDMRQKPVYVLNHSQHNFKQRSTQADLDEIEMWTDRAAKRMYEGAGLGPAGRRHLQPVRRLLDHDPVLPGGVPVARREARRRLRVLRRRHQRRRARIRSARAAATWATGALRTRHVHRQHRAASRHGRRASGEGARRDRAGGVHHAAAAAAGSCSASTRAEERDVGEAHQFRHRRHARSRGPAGLHHHRSGCGKRWRWGTSSGAAPTGRSAGSSACGRSTASPSRSRC